MPDFQRGVEAIEEAAKGGGGKFQPFTPQISWKDGDEKFVRFLTSIDDATTVLLHEWIDCGTKSFGEGKNAKTFTDWGFFLSRKDPAIDEDVDPLEQKGSSPKKRILAVVVELEPIMDSGGTNRVRPKGFEVKTQEYTRKTDDGDEEVVAPVIGVITQASKNFFKQLVSHSQSEGPVEDTAFKVRRVGGDSETAYAFTPYFDKPMDMSALLEHVGNVTYLSSDDDTWAEVEEDIERSEDSDTAAMGIGAILLNKRLNELADGDLYHERTDHIETIKDKYGKDKSKGEKQDRPARQSQRGNSKTEEPPAQVKSDRFAEIKKLAEEKKRARDTTAA